MSFEHDIREEVREICDPAGPHKHKCLWCGSNQCQVETAEGHGSSFIDDLTNLVLNHAGQHPVTAPPPPPAYTPDKSKAELVAAKLRPRPQLLFNILKELADMKLASPWVESMGHAFSAPNSPSLQWQRTDPAGNNLARIVHAHPNQGDTHLLPNQGQEGDQFSNPQQARDAFDAVLVQAGWTLL